MEMSQEFDNLNMDQINMFGKDDHIDPTPNSFGYLTQLAGKEIIQLKNNTIPKGLVPLEDFFDNNDVARDPKVTPNDVEVGDYNIG